MDDGYTTNGEGEVVIEDKDVKQIQEAVVTAKQNSQPVEFVAADGSKIKLMVDGYGNTSEMRYFDNDPKLELILLQTSVRGQKQVFVYGRNGEVKDLPPNMIDYAMTSPSKELANAAGIYEGKKQETPSRIFTGITTPSVALPMPALESGTVQTENRPTENTTAQTDVRQETIVKPADSPVEPKTPVRITENLQNFIPKKQKNAKPNE